jgi:23S rRNA pseudouridine1911/1915/1917 synthase
MTSSQTPTILYQDTDILALNKPAGLVVHADGRTDESNLTDWILEHFPQSKDVGEPIELSDGRVIHRPGIVHRLDRDTSGVMLVALTQKGFEHLKNQFQNRTIEKKYHAFVYGIIKQDEGTIDRPISRSKKDFRLWSAQRGGRGEAREAITDYKVLKRLNYNDGHCNEDVTFVEVTPHTGRTHQIRVHFKAISHPIVADPLYAPKHDPILGFKRLALHAKQITFRNLENKEITIEAPYPEDFEFALSKVV